MELMKINIVKSFLADQYRIKDLGSCRQFTGIKAGTKSKGKDNLIVSERLYSEGFGSGWYAGL